MGSVLPFQAPARAARKRAAERDASEPMGQIVFFTGVRYERHPEPQQDPRRPNAGGRRARRRRSA